MLLIQIQEERLKNFYCKNWYIYPCDYKNDHDETYINVGLLEVVIEYKDNEGCVEHKGKNSGKN